MKIVATKNGRREKFPHPPILVLLLDPGSGMDKNQDPGSGINIPDPQHWMEIVSGVHQFFFGMPQYNIESSP
jgi:hypothetical protein